MRIFRNPGPLTMHSVVTDSNGIFPVFTTVNFGNTFSLSKGACGDTEARCWIEIYSERTDTKAESSPNILILESFVGVLGGSVHIVCVSL